MMVISPRLPLTQFKPGSPTIARAFGTIQSGYYDEKKLLRQIRDIVKSVYYDYTIISVAEVYFDDQPVYIVYIQDETHLKTIGVYDGEMQEVQNYKRG